MNNPTFGEHLRALRTARQISQRALAKAVGVNFTYLSKLENDASPPPSAETLLGIADFLDKNGKGAGYAVGLVDRDKLFRLASRIPDELACIIIGSREAPALMRAIVGLSDAEVRQLIEIAERMKTDAPSAGERG